MREGGPAWVWGSDIVGVDIFITLTLTIVLESYKCMMEFMYSFLGFFNKISIYLIISIVTMEVSSDI